MKHTLLIVIIASIGLTACTSITRHPVPAEMHQQATLLGRDDLRYWGDEPIPWMDQLARDREASGKIGQHQSKISHGEHNYLAISGGGANGAYGAGLLVGWSELGTRPEFTMVTGISTGALTAPFVFLGPEYDATLKQIYTTTDTTQIIELRSVFAIFGGDAIMDTSPLSRTIEKYITDEIVEKIAAEYRNGRSLIIGTTALDAARPVLWNIGRIANTGHSDAPDLIRKILRASASIPGAFPPVYIPVQGPDGETYDEMHVDGGVASQLFLYPVHTNWHEFLESMNVKGAPRAYLIRNARIAPPYEPVQPRLLPIAGKTIQSLIRTQGVGDVFRIYSAAERDGIEVYLTWIPEEAGEDTSNEAFDPEYMSALFDFGYQLVRQGEAWLDVDEFFAGH